MKPAAGMMLGGRYVLLEQLAVGGMGEVWAARDKKLHRMVALKVLRPEYTGHQEFLRRLRTEARNSAALAHPNIAQMYDYGEEDGTGYLVMELVKGEPLSDLLERERKVPTKLLVPILAQTARGLHHAHQNSVVHRDVKPGNILLEGSPIDPYPTVKITDFGVSLAANQAPMTATGMVMGTAQYLSPEQAIGKPATARSDIYALGIVAYEAVAGHRPFTGKSPVDIAVAHVNSPVPPLPPETDPALAALIMRMLSKEPSTRPGDASLLAEELEALVGPKDGPLALAVTPETPDGSLAQATAPRRQPRRAGHITVIASGVTPDLPDVVVPAQVVPAQVVPPQVVPAEVVPDVVVAAEIVPDQEDRAPLLAAEVVDDQASEDALLAAEVVPVDLVPGEDAEEVVDELSATQAAAESADETAAAETADESAAAEPATKPKPAAQSIAATSASNAKGRRIALAVLIGVFAILGLLLLIQALAGRDNPREPSEGGTASSVIYALSSSERSSHGG